MIGGAHAAAYRQFAHRFGGAVLRSVCDMNPAQARDLAASSDFALHEIALRCGYASAAALGKAFRRAYGHAIRQAPRRG
jgi:transcriptional regulator GlxA family with amidase domain